MNLRHHFQINESALHIGTNKLHAEPLANVQACKTAHQSAFNRRMQEAEFVLSHGLTCQAEPARRSSVRVWPRGLAHRYDNLTDDMQSILCIDRPPFLEEDEIATDGTPGHISVFESREL